MSKLPYDEEGKDMDLQDLYELIELGLDENEIAKEYNISKDYVKEILKDSYKDFY